MSMFRKMAIRRMLLLTAMSLLMFPALWINASAPPGMALIPAGSFEMGDHHGFVDPKHGGDETPIHTVRLDAFYMGINDVTTREYCDFLNSALAEQQIEVRDGGVYLAGGKELLCETRTMSPYSRIEWDDMHFIVLEHKEQHPIVCIRWPGAAAYCNWLSSQNGMPLCYDAATWECDFNKSGFRLPTEAEWEYAARGGLNHPYGNFPWGDAPDAGKANWPESDNPFRAGQEPWTTPVGFFNGQLHRKDDFHWPGPQETYQTSDGVNGYGLYDMAGNVWQFVNDWYGRDYYAYSPAENPPGPDRGSVMPDGKPYRGMRGGNWYNGEHGHSRVSNRNPSYWRGPQDPNHPYYHVGFRVVLPINAENRPKVKLTPVHYIEGRDNKSDRRPHRGSQRHPRQETPPPREMGREQTEILDALGYFAPNPDHQKDQRPRGGKRMQEENKTPVSPNPGQTAGLFLDTPKAFDGYTLFAPKHNTVTYLINNQGQAVHQWKSAHEPGQTVYLKPNGNLLHCCFTKNRDFTGGGEGGRLEEFDWDGNLVWEFEYSSAQYLSHHDIAPLPNGNILMLAVEKKTQDECIAAGFNLDMLRDRELFPDSVVEVQPTYPKGGKILWKWRVWDHLIQDFDPAKANYGDVAAHPELIDVHCNGRDAPAFWNHMNSIAYNETLDQIMLSVRGCNEIWIVDHSTTAQEAADHTGGKQGKGGDLLYRWGNPAAYKRGTERDKQLIQQHDAQWIPEGSPGSGHITLFNNGYERGYSSIEEIIPPMDTSGHYIIEPGKPYGPENPVWHYEAKNPTNFFSSEISGAHRLPNGNTLICEGVIGNLFEITPDGETVWQYVNPIVRGGILAQGELPGKDVRGHLFNAVFKVHRYAPDFSGFSGRDLTPKGVIELPPESKGKTGLDQSDAPPEERPRRGGWNWWNQPPGPPSPFTR